MTDMINNNRVATEVGGGVMVQNGLTTTQTHTKAATGEEVRVQFELTVNILSAVCLLVIPFSLYEIFYSFKLRIIS